MMLDLHLIRPDPDQPRKVFEPKALQELADSIAQSGLMQPILVRPIGDEYMIVCGERRWRAHCLLAEQGRLDPAVIDAQVREMDAQEVAIAAIAENLQRLDISPLEEAAAFGRLVERGMDAAEIAERLGVPAFRVRWRLQLLQLAPDIAGLLASEHLDRQSAMELSRLPEHRDQHRVLKLIQAGKLMGWKAIRNAVEDLLAGKQQSDFFGGGVSEEQAAAVSKMEARIDALIKALALGWKDGECKIAAQVNPNRAIKMADQLGALQKAIRIMERDLRQVSAGAVLFAEAA